MVPVGNLAGANEKFNGLVLFFDSKDDDGKGDNPIVNGWMNDGTKLFNHDTDGLGTRFGGCRAKISVIHGTSTWLRGLQLWSGARGWAYVPVLINTRTCELTGDVIAIVKLTFKRFIDNADWPAYTHMQHMYRLPQGRTSLATDY